MSESEPDEDEDDPNAAADEERLARLRDHIELLESTTQQPDKTETASSRPALTLNDLMSVGLDTSARQEHAKDRKKSKQVKVFSAPLPKLVRGTTKRNRNRRLLLPCHPPSPSLHNNIRMSLTTGE